MIILIKASVYDALTHIQNLKIRNIQGHNGLYLGKGNRRVSDGTEEWVAYSHPTIDLGYEENLATSFAMIENNASILLNFEMPSIEQYRIAQNLTTHANPDSLDIAETNTAITAQGTNVIKAEIDLSAYTDVENPPMDNYIWMDAVKQKEKESFVWLNSIFEDGYDTNVGGKQYAIPCKPDDITNFAQTIQIMDLNGAPDAAPTYIRGFDYDAGQFTTLAINFGDFKNLISGLSVYYQNMHGQRAANMDVINNMTDISEIQNYQFQILGV